MRGVLRGRFDMDVLRGLNAAVERSVLTVGSVVVDLRSHSARGQGRDEGLGIAGVGARKNAVHLRDACRHDGGRGRLSVISCGLTGTDLAAPWPCGLCYPPPPPPANNKNPQKNTVRTGVSVGHAVQDLITSVPKPDTQFIRPPKKITVRTELFVGQGIRWTGGG